jgi:hypothetical protein
MSVDLGIYVYGAGALDCGFLRGLGHCCAPCGENAL